MQITGANIIAGRHSAAGEAHYSAISPTNQSALPGEFYEATMAEVAAACSLASDAATEMESAPAESIAGFLTHLAETLDEWRPMLIARCTAETALTTQRLDGELTRTVNQLRMFAEVATSEMALDVRIDQRNAARKPLPKPEILRCSVPIGPVAVFGAANFPFAFSVAGGDTASAFAARCPVIVKAHPAHPGTSELVGRIISESLKPCGLPVGAFSMLHGKSPSVALTLVRNPHVKAVGFTGSLQAGRALMAAAGQRPDPIPVFAEMGSINPVFLLPGAVRTRGSEIAEGLLNSITLGNGQFCTSPGVIVGVCSEAMDSLIQRLVSRAVTFPAAPMLHAGVLSGFYEGLQRWSRSRGLKFLTKQQAPANESRPALAVMNAVDCLADSALREEVFGPAAIIVQCDTPDQQLEVARAMPGSLTATIHGDESDTNSARALLPILQRFAGRLIWNGYPTGVEVCSSMHHGGPYPASSDSRFTAVGADAVRRWVRPVCFQDFPTDFLPTVLRSHATS